MMNSLVKDFEMSPTLEKVMGALVFLSLFFCFTGIMISGSILSLHHIFILIPSLYFLPKTNYKNYPKSVWAFFVFFLVMLLSIFYNHEIIADVGWAIGKTKFFLIALLSIAPYSWYFSKRASKKSITFLIYSMLTVSIVATLSGIYAKFYGINPITQKIPEIIDRNSGLMGSTMNYSMSLCYILLVNLALLLKKNEIKRFLNLNIEFLYLCFFVNALGLYLTYTRGAWLAFFVAAIFTLFLKFDLKKAIPCMLMGVTFMGIVYLLAGRSVERTDSDKVRMSVMESAYYGFVEKPILGYGYNNFSSYSKAIKEKYNLYRPDLEYGAHNNYLDVLASMGLIGFVSLMSWIGLSFIDFFKNRKNELVCGGGALFVFFLIRSLTESTFFGSIYLGSFLGFYAVQVALNKKIHLKS